MSRYSERWISSIMNKLTTINRSCFLRKSIRFSATGVLITTLHIMITIFLIDSIYITPPTANGIAFTLSTLVSYTINTLWSFSARLHGRTLLRFLTVSLVGLTVSVTIAWLAQYFGYRYWVGVLGVVILVPLITFLLHSRWTYR